MIDHIASAHDFPIPSEAGQQQQTPQRSEAAHCFFRRHISGVISRMSNPLFIVTTPGERHRQPQLLGRFYTSDHSPLSTAEKHLICNRLNVAFEDGLLFESTALACGDALIGRAPDCTLPNGRKFWVYRPDERMPR